jgi:hypothetical protein
MKMIKVLIPCLLILMVMESKAQTSKEITDDDLKKYAVTMDSVAAMQESLRQIVAETVQKNTVMEISRYNELFKIADDEARLKEKKVTPEEIAFLKQIDDLRKVNIERINASYQSLAKEYVGLKAFNAIRKSLNSDQELKARYENMAKDLESKAKGG